MKTLLSAIVLSVFIGLFPAKANDGVFYAQGNHLIPLQETRIELRKEILKFFVSEYDHVNVDVYFEFYNPDGERKLTVGFVSPPAMGDFGDEEFDHPRISGFTVVVNGDSLQHKVAKMEETSFNAEALDVPGFDYVYYFDVTFKPGLNIVKHTYRFRGGGSVETQRDFDYQITTGKRWANKQIDDFTLELHLDEGIFNLPARFVKDGGLANWKLVGDGVMKQKAEKFYEFDDESIRMVHLNRGYIELREKNFKPDFDIHISEFNWFTGRIEKMCKGGKKCLTEDEVDRLGIYLTRSPGEYIETGQLKELSAKELKMMRNFGFALRGYEFKSADLKAFYSKFFWYKPDATLKAEEIELSGAEKAFIDKVRSVEASKGS